MANIKELEKLIKLIADMTPEEVADAREFVEHLKKSHNEGDKDV